MLCTTSSASVTLPVGGLWTIAVEVRDDDGNLDDTQTITVTVTEPDGGTSTEIAEQTDAGQYRVLYTATSAGRYTANVATDNDAANFAAYVTDNTTAAGMPTTDDVLAYTGEISFSPDEIQDALDAEAAAQRAVCVVGAAYTDDLRQALLRRVQRNLHMRRQPLALVTDEIAGATRLGGIDPEVKRLEAPYRRRRVA